MKREARGLDDTEAKPGVQCNLKRPGDEADDAPLRPFDGACTAPRRVLDW